MMPPSQAGDEQAAEARRDRHGQPRDDLDDADDVHRVGRAAGDDVVEGGREVARPVVGQDARELVEAEQDRRDGERDPQQRERLRDGIAAQRARGGDGSGPQGGSDGAGHEAPPWETVDSSVSGTSGSARRRGSAGWPISAPIVLGDVPHVHVHPGHDAAAGEPEGDELAASPGRRGGRRDPSRRGGPSTPSRRRTGRRRSTACARRARPRRAWRAPPRGPGAARCPSARRAAGRSAGWRWLATSPAAKMPGDARLEPPVDEHAVLDRQPGRLGEPRPRRRPHADDDRVAGDRRAVLQRARARPGRRPRTPTTPASMRRSTPWSRWRSR